MGLLVAIPSFKVRGDYLAIITLAFLMIVKSALENIDAIGGPRRHAGDCAADLRPGSFRVDGGPRVADP
jgi:ABC-type branched-subunit amino acid transport system permease subunit